MKKLLVAALFSLALATPSLAQDKPIKVSGCAMRGAVVGMHGAADSVRQNIQYQPAQPMPTPDTYGTVEGTLRNWITFCQQGPVIDPAKWTQTGKLCPLHKAKK